MISGSRPSFRKRKTPPKVVTSSGANTNKHAPGRIRTCDLLLRRQALYPTELRAQHDEEDSLGVGLLVGGFEGFHRLALSPSYSYCSSRISRSCPTCTTCLTWPTCRVG